MTLKDLTAAEAKELLKKIVEKNIPDEAEKKEILSLIDQKEMPLVRFVSYRITQLKIVLSDDEKKLMKDLYFFYG